jgi:hypothetical protein
MADLGRTVTYGLLNKEVVVLNDRANQTIGSAKAQESDNTSTQSMGLRAEFGINYQICSTCYPYWDYI